MTATAPPPQGTQPSAWQLYRALVGVGLLCGLLIVTVVELTRPTIAGNRAEARQRAILDVLPGAVDSATLYAANGVEGGGGFTAATVDQEAMGRDLIFAGYDREGQLVGVALEAAAMGYADTIRILYGYDPEQEVVIGIKVLESRETPGLGDRIEKDPAFLANFARLDASQKHPIELVKPGTKQNPWEVDGISGATISARAIAEMLRDSTAVWVPRLRGQEQTLQREQ